MSKWYIFFLYIFIPQLQANEVRPMVFVSVPPQKQIVERLTGEKVDVIIMLSPGQAPETFAPTPKQITSLAGADSYFEAGVPFEVTWRSAIRAVNPGIRIVSCCESLYSGKNSEAGKHGYLHTWTDPLLTIEMARLAQAELEYLLPEHKELIWDNFLELEAEITQVHMRIKEKLSNRQTSYFIITHSALDAFSDRYDLKQLSLETNGREIGLSSLTEMVQLSRREKIRTLFVLEQYRSPMIVNLAKELNAETVTLDILAENYIDNMLNISELMARAIRAQ